MKVGAPADVSSVGGTPGVWCLNVIGRECWVWVVPCTGSWPDQPPPTTWGKEPSPQGVPVLEKTGRPQNEMVVVVVVVVVVVE